LHYLFTRLDRKKFEASIRKWLSGQQARGWTTLSVDGKTLRGGQGHEIPGVHLLAAYAHEAKLVLEQVPVDGKTNEHKTALQLLNMIPLKDKVVFGDALFCQRDLSLKISKKGGDWIWPVKGNQPELRAALELAFEDVKLSPSREKVDACRTAKRDDIR
jgi:predicted transposase YbfD/YdcC